MVKAQISKRNIGNIVGNKLIPDFYQTGFDKLPYDESTRAEFFRFRDACDDAVRRLRPAMGSLYSGEPISDPSQREEVLKLEKMNFELKPVHPLVSLLGNMAVSTFP